MADRSRRHRNDDDERYAPTRRRDLSTEDRSHEKGRQVVSRREPENSSRHHSEPEESDDEPKRRHKHRSDSRALAKSGSKSKDKRKKSSRKKEESEPEDSDEEIVTKRMRFEEVDISDLDPEYIDALIGCLHVTHTKIEKWCHNGLVRLDTKEDCMNADKAVKQEADEGEAAEWARYEKRYKRAIKEDGGEMRRLGRSGEDTGASSSRPARIVYAEPPGPIRGAAALFEAHRFNPRCGHCHWQQGFCGDPYHRLQRVSPN